MEAEPQHAALFIEFLEVCIHTILCLRQVYPEEVFSKHRAFGVSVRMWCVKKLP